MSDAPEDDKVEVSESIRAADASLMLFTFLRLEYLKPTYAVWTAKVTNAIDFFAKNPRISESMFLEMAGQLINRVEVSEPFSHGCGAATWTNQYTDLDGIKVRIEVLGRYLQLEFYRAHRQGETLVVSLTIAKTGEYRYYFKPSIEPVVNLEVALLLRKVAAAFEAISVAASSGTSYPTGAKLGKPISHLLALFANYRA